MQPLLCKERAVSYMEIFLGYWTNLMFQAFAATGEILRSIAKTRIVEVVDS